MEKWVARGHREDLPAVTKFAASASGVQLVYGALYCFDLLLFQLFFCYMKLMLPFSPASNIPHLLPSQQVIHKEAEEKFAVYICLYFYLLCSMFYYFWTP